MQVYSRIAPAGCLLAAAAKPGLWSECLLFEVDDGAAAGHDGGKQGRGLRHHALREEARGGYLRAVEGDIGRLAVERVDGEARHPSPQVALSHEAHEPEVVIGG